MAAQNQGELVRCSDVAIFFLQAQRITRSMTWSVIPVIPCAKSPKRKSMHRPVWIRSSEELQALCIMMRNQTQQQRGAQLICPSACSLYSCFLFNLSQQLTTFAVSFSASLLCHMRLRASQRQWSYLEVLALRKSAASPIHSPFTMLQHTCNRKNVRVTVVRTFFRVKRGVTSLRKTSPQEIIGA